jgi:NADPH:quinone reductase-like Zn-dependent oxidoreductase
MLGADHVIDYTLVDFTRNGTTYDVLFDVKGTRSVAECARVLAPSARWIVAGGPRSNRWIGPLGALARLSLGSLTGGPRPRMFMARVTREDLLALRELIEAGHVAPVLECYAWSDAEAALRHLVAGRPLGKIVVSIGDGATPRGAPAAP